MGGIPWTRNWTWRLWSGHSRHTREPSGWTKAAIHPQKHRSKGQPASGLTWGGIEELSLKCTLPIPWVRFSMGSFWLLINFPNMLQKLNSAARSTRSLHKWVTVSFLVSPQWPRPSGSSAHSHAHSCLPMVFCLIVHSSDASRMAACYILFIYPTNPVPSFPLKLCICTISGFKLKSLYLCMFFSDLLK